MKFKIFLSFLLFCINVSANNNSSKILTSNCTQTFHFFFLSRGEYPVFWIGEDVSGDCDYSQLLNIAIKDSTISFVKSGLLEYNNWGCIPELKSLFNKYDEEIFTKKNNTWQLKGIKISPPKYDSILTEEFYEHIRKGGSDASSWIKEKGNKGIILPGIEGIKTELLFYYKIGLYINYDISEAYYLAQNYILVFTHQPIKAVGMDTMHGFLIFRIKKHIKIKRYNKAI